MKILNRWCTQVRSARESRSSAGNCDYSALNPLRKTTIVFLRISNRALTVRNCAKIREVRVRNVSVVNEVWSSTEALLQHRLSSNSVPAEQAQLGEEDGNSGDDGRRMKKLSRNGRPSQERS